LYDDGRGSRATGKERDAESGLDYFEARYYGSALGRFTSPDPENAGAFPSDPQSWNAYAYVRNNPLKYTDPHGLTYQVCDSNGKNCSNLSDADFESEEGAGKSNGEHFSNGSLYHYDSNGGRVNDGTYQQTDVDLTSPQFLAVQSGVNQARGPVNLATGATLAFVTGGLGLEAAAIGETATLIPGLAPSGEYTSAIRALDALGESNPGATLNPAQARALAQNVVDVLNKTIPNAEARGTQAFVQAVKNQLANPRFQFLNQIPGPLKEELVNAAARLGIAIK
jgi:RHS repeat-associated protein